MDACPQTEPFDLSLQLPRDLYYQVVHTLRGLMPPPITDSPEDLVRRDHAAIAMVASLLPGNADEANLAAHYVGASTHASLCLRAAMAHPADSEPARQCRAQAALMMREARGFRSLLLRVQAVRQKREADGNAANRAAWVEHCAVGLMVDALGDAPAPVVAEPPPPPPPPKPPVVEPATEDEPQHDPVALAEEYAANYPRRAALIRRLGRLPDKLTFGPPEPDLVHALVTGRTPALLALDLETVG